MNVIKLYRVARECGVTNTLLAVFAVIGEKADERLKARNGIK